MIGSTRLARRAGIAFGLGGFLLILVRVMNWSAVGAIGELLGAAAVVVSLLYLAAQMRMGARQAQLEAGRNLSRGIGDVSLALSVNGELGLWVGVRVPGGAWTET